VNEPRRFAPVQSGSFRTQKPRCRQQLIGQSVSGSAQQAAKAKLVETSLSEGLAWG
jgi:hypothetical protein